MEGAAEELKSQLQRSVEAHDEFFNSIIVSNVHVLDVVAGVGKVRGQAPDNELRQ